ncbi:MAG: hypothetical protein ABIA12_00500 [Candidatus Aenigmatarchaeota archaeon]
MPLKIEVEEVLEWYKKNGIPLERTKIYLCDKLENVTDGEGGMFLPRSYEGYVLLVQDENEVLARYVHESAHGSFFENFPIGQTLATLDREVYDLEKSLFGDEKIENIIVIEKELTNSQSKKLSKKEIEASGIESLFKNRPVYEIDKKHFGSYREKASRLKNLQSALIPHIEGFSLLVEEEILGRITRTVSKDYYIEGYNLLKPLKENGFSSVVDYLKRLNVSDF